MSAKARLILCPYCGNTQQTPEDRCAACGGFFDPQSLKVTQRHMGPWFIRDRDHPFRPGCSYEVLVREIEQGKIKPTTILRGPTTRQFWSVARNVAGVAHRLGYCHACGAHVQPEAPRCPQCDAVFFSPKLRDQLGLAEAHVEVTTGQGMAESGALRATVDATEMGQGQARNETEATSGTSTADSSEGAAASESSAEEDAAVQDGSPILAGLRPNASPSPAATDRATNESDEPKTTATDNDALHWLTSGTDAQPDTLPSTGPPTAATPASGDTQGDLMARLGQTHWLTWLLIAINALLFIAAIVTVVVLATAGSPDRSTRPPFDPTPPTDEGTNTARPDAGTTNTPAVQPTESEPEPDPDPEADLDLDADPERDPNPNPDNPRESDSVNGSNPDPTNIEADTAPQDQPQSPPPSPDRGAIPGEDDPEGGTFFGLPTNGPRDAPTDADRSPASPQTPTDPPTAEGDDADERDTTTDPE